MSSHTHDFSRKSQKSSEAPVINPFQSRGFGIQTQAETSALPQGNVEAQSEGTERYGYNLFNLPVNAPGTAPPPPIQTKLTIGQPGDQYEQEADMMASKVMSMSAQTDNQQLHTKPLASTINPFVQRRTAQEPNLEQTGSKLESQLKEASVLYAVLPLIAAYEIYVGVGTIIVAVSAVGIIINWKDITGAITQLGQIAIDWATDTASNITNKIVSLIDSIPGITQSISQKAHISIEDVVNRVFEEKQSKLYPLASINGGRLLGNTRQLAVHLARLLRLSEVGGMPPKEPPDPGNDNDKHWWQEIKNFVKGVQQAIKNASRKQVMRELNKEFTEEQILDIERRLAEAAKKMDDDIPPLLPPN